MEQKPDCPACGGTGKAIDHQAVGAELRKARLAKGTKLSYIASVLGITSSQLSMLEAGKRRWRPETITAYKAALEPAAAAPTSTPTQAA